MKKRNEHGNCPHCNADLDGGSIWETFYQKALHGEYYGQQGRPADDDEAQEIADLAAEQYGATRGNGRWGRAIGLYDVNRDRTTQWVCPDCHGVWDRV